MGGLKPQAAIWLLLLIAHTQAVRESNYFPITYLKAKGYLFHTKDIIFLPSYL